MATCLIGLGSNLGDRAEILEQALLRLAEHNHTNLKARSGFYETTPVGGSSGQGQFLNAAALLETTLKPPALLKLLQAIESDLGRQPAEHWSARTLDLDILLIDKAVLSTAGLEVPHPRMSFRQFVLKPAAEIAPAMVHPIVGWDIARLLGHITSPPNYVAITGPMSVGKTQLAHDVASELSGCDGITVKLIDQPINQQRLHTVNTGADGRRLDTEIELLNERAGLLNTSVWLDESTWVISDFWLDQSAAYANFWLNQTQLATFGQHWQQATAQVATPKLLVVMQSSIDELERNIRRQGRPGERELPKSTIRRPADALQEHVGLGGHGPVLFLPSGDRRRNVEELAAAIIAMDHI